MRMLSKSFVVALLLTVVVGPLAAADLKEDLLAREKAFWTSWGEKKADIFRAETAEDYVQVVAGVGLMSGRETVASAIEKHDCVMKSFAFSDANLRQPVPNVAVLTYVAKQDTTCGGVALADKIFATAIWVERDGKWIGYSYQETPIE